MQLRQVTLIVTQTRAHSALFCRDALEWLEMPEETYGLEA
jgi:hypothetical protein